MEHTINSSHELNIPHLSPRLEAARELPNPYNWREIHARSHPSVGTAGGLRCETNRSAWTSADRQNRLGWRHPPLLHEAPQYCSRRNPAPPSHEGTAQTTKTTAQGRGLSEVWILYVMNDQQQPQISRPTQGKHDVVAPRRTFRQKLHESSVIIVHAIPRAGKHA